MLAVASLAGQAVEPAPTPGTSTRHAVDPRADVAAGRVEELSVPSGRVGNARRVWIYTPPRYAPDPAAPYGLLAVFDGREYVEDIQLPKILDGLLAAGKTPPLVAVFIDNATGTARLEDLANRARFAAFLGDELLPWVRSRWNVTRDPRRAIVAGSSAGGLAAAYVAWKRPDLFGNVLSQSGAFWRGNEGSNDPPYEWLTSQYAAAPKRDIRFVLEVGALESQGALGGAAPSILEANRRLRDALRKKGYDVTYAEVPNGRHTQESWRLGLPAALARLAGSQSR
jgi:enterochelin esterase family protein